jgi:hypothetical protein
MSLYVGYTIRHNKQSGKAIEDNWHLLCEEWDAMYPNNPVPAHEGNGDDENN